MIFNAKGQLNSKWIYEVIICQNADLKLPRFLPYPLINFRGRNVGNFWLAFWMKRWPQKFILNFTKGSWIRLPVLSVPRKSTSFLQYRSCRIEIILLYPISRSINGIDVTHFYSAKRIFTMGWRRILSRMEGCLTPARTLSISGLKFRVLKLTSLT